MKKNSPDELHKSRLTAVALGVALLAVIAWFGITAEAVIERGDGVNHYLIAKWSWAHPSLFLDHWGKPLFTLCASPFAQFGMSGVVFFNLISSLIAIICAMRILRKAGWFALLAYPAFLLLAPLYVLMILAGMTEPFFGVLTVIVTALLQDRRYAAGTIVASLLPFARPESLAFVPFVGVLLIMERQWRKLPLLATGWFVYSLIGWFALGDFNWFIHNDPYANGPSIYGSGDPMVFLKGLDNITGRPMLVFFIAGLIAWPYLRWKDGEERRTADLMLLLCALPAILILCLHMVLWKLGIKGSAGILRVVTTAVPMAAIFSAYVIPRLVRISGIARTVKTTFRIAPACGLFIWASIDFFDHRILPIKPSSDEQALRKIGERVAIALGPEAKLFTTHPFLAICADVDPFDPERYEMTYGFSGLTKRMRAGDILFWDNELGPNESGIPFDSIWCDDQLELVMMAEPAMGHKVIKDVYYELYAFRKAPAIRACSIDTLVLGNRIQDGITQQLDTSLSADPGAWCFRTVPEPMVISGLPMPDTTVLLDEYSVRLTVKTDTNMHQDLALVYEQFEGNNTIRRRQEELTAGREEFALRVPPVNGAVTQRFTLSNLKGVACTVSQFAVIRKRWTQSKQNRGADPL